MNQPKVEDGIVKNASQLKLYWAEQAHREYIFSRGGYSLLREIASDPAYPSKEEPQEVIHRHINYHSDLSKEQWDRIEQAIRHISYLDKKSQGLFDNKIKVDKQNRYTKYV